MAEDFTRLLRCARNDGSIKLDCVLCVEASTCHVRYHPLLAFGALPAVTTVTRRLALAILNGFDAFFAEYKNITLGAQARFEAADWQAAQKAMRDRLDLWKQKRKIVAEAVTTITAGGIYDRDNWEVAKAEYSELIQHHPNFEIAQSFFNSISVSYTHLTLPTNREV